MIGHVGFWQVVLVLVVIALAFGSKRLPDTARALGKSLRILQSETSALRREGRSRAERSEAAPADDPTPHRTIQAAPGDVASSRPVDEPKNTARG